MAQTLLNFQKKIIIEFELNVNSFYSFLDHLDSNQSNELIKTFLLFLCFKSQSTSNCLSLNLSNKHWYVDTCTP